MSLTTSFTAFRGPRFPAPDVSRGLMLLFIALANTPFWVVTTRSSAPGDAVDTAWLWVRTLLVDHRAYPLFAMLFGFGLATMINRRIASGTQACLQSLPGVDAGREPTPQEVAWAREQATLDARRLVRRRGLWMILFGAAHAVLFSGDIIGTYGLVAVVFAGWLSRKHWKRATAVSAVVTALVITTMYTMGSFVAAQGLSAAAGGQPQATGATTPLSQAVASVTSWGGNTVLTVLLSMVLPSMFLGARLADTDLIAHPERHRRLLAAVGLIGLGVGAAGGVGYAIWSTGGHLAAWAAPLHEVTGLAGACGWLALLALYAGGPTSDGTARRELTGPRRMASAVGRRSMTAYLTQTLLLAAVFLIVPALTGIELHLGEARAAGMALVVWLVTVGLCVALDRGGHAGPFETLLRTAVARSERRRRLPAPPSPAAPVEHGVSPDVYELVR
ncbi:DUF418 domain-containing protein [Actinomyces sp. ZJ308]|uniref:DUF418 domain-containing protein n=1 Tax=Actinomyces sp. ZJ308 TaxID=2708342 RepID=UPI0014225D2B|nr:DUF418 domain-containing protein [Actinomyces sp. ZJ308]